MGADKAVQNTNTTISAISGLLKRTWFVGLVLWCVLIVQIVGIFTKTHPLQVARDFLVETLSLTAIAPYFGWVEDHLAEPLRTQPGITIAVVLVFVLLAVSFSSFIRDAYTGEDAGSFASLKSMVRFVIYTTYAALFYEGFGLAWLIVSIVITAVAVGFAGASTTVKGSDWVENVGNTLRRGTMEFVKCAGAFVLDFALALIFPLALALIVVINAIL